MPLSHGWVRRVVHTRFGARVSVPEPLAAGEWSQAYSMTLDGADVVLRLGAHGDDFEKDSIAARLRPEGARISVPRIMERGTLDGVCYAVSERAWGTALDDLSSTHVAAALPALLRALDEIGRIDVSHTSGYGIWPPSEKAPHGSWPEALLAIEVETPRVPGWRAALERSDVGFGPFDAGLARLSALAPALPDERRLVHGDLLSRNVLVADGAVAAILDWGNAQYGDSLYDAAWLIYWWPWYPQWSDIDIHAELMTHGRTVGPVRENVDERVLACLIHIGLDAMAYCAFKGQWDDLRRNADTVLELAGR